MARPIMPSFAVDEKFAGLPLDPQSRAERDRHDMRELDAGAGIGVGPQDRDPVGRRLGGTERGGVEIADIAVTFELNPGQSVALLVDGGGFAIERLRLPRRAGLGPTPERRLGRDDSDRAAFDKTRRVHLSAQMCGGEIGTGWGQARVEGGHARCI